jgi:hypothetical protein
MLQSSEMILEMDYFEPDMAEGPGTIRMSGLLLNLREIRLLIYQV